MDAVRFFVRSRSREPVETAAGVAPIPCPASEPYAYSAESESGADLGEAMAIFLTGSVLMLLGCALAILVTCRPKEGR